MPNNEINEVNNNKYVCVVCGSEHIHNKKRLLCKKCYNHEYNTTRRNKQAEKVRMAKYRAENFEMWIVTRFKSKAKKEGRDFDLDPAWVKNELARGNCAVTGMPFKLPKYNPGQTGKRGQWTPSIDRIDNSKGYTKSNCRMVVWMYNLAKNNYTDNDIVKMSIALATKFMISMHKDNKDSSIVSHLKGMQTAILTS